MWTQSDKLSLSAVYEDCAHFLKWLLKSVIKRTFVDPVQTITLSLQLKPFAKFVFSQSLNDEPMGFMF